MKFGSALKESLVGTLVVISFLSGMATGAVAAVAMGYAIVTHFAGGWRFLAIPVGLALFIGCMALGFTPWILTTRR